MTGVRALNSRWPLAALLAVILLGSCKEVTGPEEDPGLFRVVVDQAPSQLSGVLVEVDGEGLDGLASQAGEIIPLSASAGGYRFILAGSLSVGQPAFTINSADRRTPPVVRVTQVAGSAQAGYQHLPTSTVVLRPVR